MDFYFKHPTTIQISWPTGCGKTWFVRRIQEEQHIQPFPTRIIWIYSEWQSYYDHVRATFPHVEFVEGWREDLYASIRPDERNLLILDDQMDEAGDSKTLSKLFKKGLHHRNLTVIYLVQNVFNQSKSQRTVSLNSHYNFATDAMPANIERSLTRCVQTTRVGFWTRSNARRVGRTVTSYWTIIH